MNFVISDVTFDLRIIRDKNTNGNSSIDDCCVMRYPLCVSMGVIGSASQRAALEPWIVFPPPDVPFQLTNKPWSWHISSNSTSLVVCEYQKTRQKEIQDDDVNELRRRFKLDAIHQKEYYLWKYQLFSPVRAVCIHITWLLYTHF